MLKCCNSSNISLVLQDYLCEEALYHEADIPEFIEVAVSLERVSVRIIFLLALCIAGIFIALLSTWISELNCFSSI